MASPYINIYSGNPTEGLTDGTLVSTGNLQTAPVTVTLDASINESKKIKLAIRCESGYETLGDTTISDSNDTNDRWKFSLSENGTFADSITISSTIGATNVIFWAQASSSDSENPVRDSSVSIRIATTIQAAA